VQNDFGGSFWASVNGMWFACESVRHLRALELIEGSVGWEITSDDSLMFLDISEQKPWGIDRIICSFSQKYST